TTMFSTTLTTLDSSPRVMSLTTELIQEKPLTNGYLRWLILLVIGTLAIFFFFVSEMGLLIKIATILSFLTAPFYAIINFKLITGKNTPISARPSKPLQIYSVICIAILLAFSIWFLTTL
ncbi:MAG: Mn2+/Fe2+ NRAMP family transporter, partial [Flavobacteriaceae bacterium]